MARVPAPSQVSHVLEYEYIMDGEHTGNIFLMDSPSKGFLVSFRSARTGLTTDWHGTWRRLPGPQPTDGIEMFFDCKCRARWPVVLKAKGATVPQQEIYYKWAQVHPTMRSLGRRLVGNDYQQRAISMSLVEHWTHEGAGAQMMRCRAGPPHPITVPDRSCPHYTIWFTGTQPRTLSS